jgi:DNA-binding FadR family transcriptional regulator
MRASEIPGGAGGGGETGRPLCSETLFPRIVGEMLGGLKSGCRLANLIEEELIQRRWPVGTIYGSEAELSRRFHVGRTVIREAVRVLEVRGCARMRRGPNGGLLVLRPSRSQSAEIVADYTVLVGISDEQIDDAERMLSRIKAQLDGGRHRSHALELAQIQSIAIPFFEELIETVKKLNRATLDVRAGTKSRPLFHHSRAGQIARRMMMQCTPQQWIRGVRLGSTFDLCERYSIHRDVLRQAVRILESAGMAMSLSGRGKGILSQAPRPASMCRLISCHFAAHGLSPAAAMALYECISVEAIAKVAALATCAEIERIEHALSKAWSDFESGSEEQLTNDIYELEESQLGILNNPLIDLFLRSTKAFPAWGYPLIDASASLNPVYLAETRKVVFAIASGSATAAARAQEIKVRRLTEISQRPHDHAA